MGWGGQPSTGGSRSNGKGGHAAHRSWNVYFEWNEPDFSGGQIFKEMRTTKDPKMTPSLALGSWQGIEPEERYTLLNGGASPSSQGERKEPGETLPDWRGIGIENRVGLKNRYAGRRQGCGKARSFREATAPAGS
jgi:hypothetical protein